MPSLTSIEDLSNQEIRQILELAARLRSQPSSALRGKIVATAFFEPSTRTRLSFEAAAHRLGADVIGFADGANTSSAKGESLEDSIRVLSGYADVIVLRHPEMGAAARAGALSSVPIINAGDGAGEHPTQTLLDLFTMEQALGDLSGKCVAVVGDLRYGRTVHSLVPALQRLGATVFQVPAPGLELPSDVAELETVSLTSAAASCDVLYATRVQTERLQGESTSVPVIDAALLAHSKAIVMHPLPRVDEVSTDVDALPAAKYFEQARNGVPVRMAVLAYTLGVAP